MEDSENEEDGHSNSPRKILSSEPTREPVNPSEKSNEETTSAPDTGTSSEPSGPTREYNKGHPAPGDITKY